LDRRRLADIRAGTAWEQRSSGSGYLAGQRLVLTCRHVVADGQGGVWPRLDVWLGHPADGTRHRVAATLAWVHPDPGVDAALLRIDGDHPEVPGLVRWGCFAGVSPVPYVGLGFPEFADYESGRGVEQLNGTLLPLSVGPDGAFVLDQGAAPEPAQRRAWPGASGAAVFCGDLLVAIVVKDDRAFGNRRLHAVPASALTDEPGFAGLVNGDSGAAPTLEAVELAEFLQPPALVQRARTPGSLLAPTAEVVDFTGRAAELARLSAWRDDGETFSVLLVTGEGGQGKTRLGRQFAATTRQAGWAAGFLSPRLAWTAGDADLLQMTVRVRTATRPVLLAVDYAETRVEEVTALVDVLRTSLLAQPVRLLLLSRTAGAWWDDLAEIVGQDAAQRIGLRALTEAGEDRRDVYAAAVTGLARRLAMLPESPTGQPPKQEWSALAAGLAADPPDLDDPRLGNALSLQIVALTSLLAAAAEQVPHSDFGEQALVRHETGYLRRAAARRRLYDPGILSDRADDKERAAEAWQTLERALAGVILFGPVETDLARAIGALASHARADDVMNWLAALYPPPAENAGIGAVQPDRLAELILGPILSRQPGLLNEIGVLAQMANDGYQVLFTLVRTAAQPDFTHIGEQTASLIATHPARFATEALVLAAALQETGALREGLVRLGHQDSEAFDQFVFAVVNQLPELSVSGAMLSAALTFVLTEVLRALTEIEPGAFLQALATSLSNLGNRLAQVGRRQEALGPTQEAAGMFRWLAEISPDDCLPGLAMSLSNLGARLAELGRQRDALGPVQEAVTIRRRLAEANPHAHLPDLAMSLSNLGARLAGVGRQRDALGPVQEAVTIRRRLAEANPDAHLPDLAMSLNNLGNLLAEAGQGQEALGPAQEAAEAFRQLTEANPDAFLPYLAISLSNLGAQLAEVGRGQDALGPAQEAAEAYRRLAEASPDAFLPDLAMSLNNLSVLLARMERRQDALGPAEEAVTIRRRLAEANPDGSLPGLTTSLNNLGVRLAEVGRDSEISQIWESAIAGLPDELSRLTMLVAKARHLLGLPDLRGGVELLTKVLTTPGIPGPAEADARRLLRWLWRQHPGDVEAAWQLASTTPLPGWICLTDEQINTITAWINAATWADSREHFRDHARMLTGDTMSTVLDEVALTAPAYLIDSHRRLLEAIGADGLEVAYQPLLLANTVEQWRATPTWEASRAFVEDHPELLGENVPAILAVLAGEDPGPADSIRQALLTIAAGPAGADGAYRSLQDATTLLATVNAAIATRDARMLQACGLIEALAHKRSLAGTLHMTLALHLADPAGRLPDGLGRELQTMAILTGAAEKDTALARFAAELENITPGSALADEVRHALGM
jgi:tetratricopeptide (TPR) repeat protein